MSFYSPLYLIFILGLIPIILMYLLKKKHEDVVLSSNYLWEKALKDMEANKPWQKLRNNLLLFLQILTFTLIVLALAKPHIFKGNLNSDNLIIVLDKSASMKTKDVDGKTRFQKAKEDIEDIIKNTKVSTKITLISMDNKPNILISNSKDKSLIKKKLQDTSPNDSSDNIKDTISIIKSLAKDLGTNNYNVLFYTDKAINTDINNLKVNKINEQGVNVSIDNISYSKVEESITVLTTVTNHSNKEQKFDISICGDEKILDVKEVELKGKETKDIYFEGITKDINILKSEIDIEDSLDIDNVRYQVINDDSMKKALIASEKGNVFLEKAIGIHNNIEVYKLNEKLESDLKGYDLYVFDGKIPKDIPKDGNLIIFNPPNNDMFKASAGDSKGELKLVEDELFKYVNLDFYIDKTNIIENTNWLEPIVTLNDKSIIAKGTKENQNMVVVGFDIRNTDLPLKVDFPILIQNMLDYTLNLKTQDKVEVLAGESIDINILPKTTETYIKSPSGEKQNIIGLTYTDTITTGLYTIEQKTDNETIESYFVSNVDTLKESTDKVESYKETNTASDEDNKFQEKINGKSSEESKAITGKDITNIILIIALIALSIEWVVYNRGY